MHSAARFLEAAAFLSITFGSLAGRLAAQPPTPSSKTNDALTAAVRTEVIEGVLQRLRETYVFPEAAQKMDEAIREHCAKQEYDQISRPAELARLLTTQLREICHDKHLTVRYSTKSLPAGSLLAATPEQQEKMREQAAGRNFGFEKVERLPGNVGYVDLRSFQPPAWAGETAAAAMNFVSNTDALLLDLRNNGGGEPAMVALLCSYFFPADPVVHINDLYYRPDNTTQQWWTQPYLPGKRYVGKEVYLLTSRVTFSAAEELIFGLKNLKRVTVVGETTRGGASIEEPLRVNDHFFVEVPAGRVINPITKTNWEGTGIKPDVETPASLALKTAHGAALQKLAEKNKDPQAGKRLLRLASSVQEELDELKAKKKGTTP